MRKFLNRISAFMILFIAIFFHTQAQDGIIKGKVKGGEEVLQVATVSIGKKTVLTNDAGEFLISIKPGTHTLTISHTGYHAYKKEVAVNPGEIIELGIELEKAEQLKEVLLGSRSFIQRSSMNTAVPVDVISGSKLTVALNNLTQQLFITIPSFNSPPQTVGPSAYVNPATLRGLGPEHTLVLLNGQRRHTSANILAQYSIGYGSAGTDLNCFPSAAIEEVQVLRDGASAQLGSDAIAGVVDIRLKKLTGKTEVNVHLGQFYKRDGETISFDINRGFKIRKGFINFTVASRFSKPTQRNGVFDTTVYIPIPLNATPQQKKDSIAKDDSIVLARGFDRLNHRRIGSPQIFNSSLIINGGYPLSKRTNLFWTGTFNYRYTADRGSNLYRYPKNKASINDSLFPDGFQMEYFVTTLNASVIAGIEGQTNKGWNWNISTAYGGNSNELFLTNTNNASQQFTHGKNAQTSFHPGSITFKQNTNNLNISRDFSNQLKHIKSLSLFFGGEYRIDNYRINKGEEASWKNYDPTHKKQWGSQGASGYSDSNVVNKNRYVNAAYLELEMETNEKFLWNFAGRYEHYSDYGGNLAGKLALRYKLSNLFLLRASFSNGFRAPAIQQRYFSNTSPVASRGIILIAETFRNDSHTAKAFGIAPLEAEKSLNISGGITSRISKNINITLDAYWIQISNRITLTGLIQRDSSDWVKSILNSLNKTDIAAIRFFANAISTRTKGIDLVATGNWPIGKSFFEISLSANYNKTHIYKTIQPAKNLPDDAKHLNLVVNHEEIGRVELAQPVSKIILSVSYRTGKWDFNFRTVYFGKAAHLAANRDLTTGLYPDEFFSPKTLAGCSIGYSPIKWFTMKVGARNIFNTYPDKIKNKSNTQSGLVIYDFNGTQIGYNGGYYFMNMSFNF